jgi:RHS repeat-associated protein
MLAQNSYNELGTLVEKKLHSTNGGSSALQTVNYAYNIRGWLTSVNDPNSLGSDLFAMKLNYESVDANIAGTTQYNGNISQQIWATSTAARHAYGYSYDQLNQLSIAEYEKYAGSWNQDAGRFNESATYDLNGNIMTMTRGGKVDWSANTYGTMDNLSMTYNGNKLIGSNDAVADIANNQKYDFSDQGMEAAIDVNNASTHEYLYDVNGNMIEDKNKHMTVAYNFLNLPTQVDFGSGNKIEWAYTVSGAKLRKTVYTNGTVTLTQDYVSGFVYKNGSLDFFSTETGRVKNQSGSLKYQYTLSDHLGNTRVMFADTNNNGSPEIIEESHYYAFGMRIEGLSTTNPDNKFTYNGKELEDDHGLNWYHYGARYYDPQIGRWWVIDPADEFYSPYTYGPNNPVNGADPNGMWWEELWNWVRFGAWKDNETIGRWERLATTFDPENYDESMLETGFLDYYDKRQHELATIELMTGQASEFDPLAGSDPETLRSMNRGTDIGYYSIAYARWKYHNQIHSAVVGGVAGGIRGASPGMKALFEGGTVEGKSIIGIRETLLKNGFKFEGLSRDKKAYLFTFGKESVRIRPMGNDTWEILMQNAVGNRLDKYGNVSTGMGPAHGIRVYSK